MSDESGYIPLWRKLRDNFLWKEKRVFSKAEAWIDILLEVRFKDEPDDVLIGNRFVTCNKGESLNSLQTWADRWGWDRSKVVRFLKLLSSDTCRMIETRGVGKTTHLKVVNYCTYHDLAKRKRNSDETQMKFKRNANEIQMNTEEESKEGNKDNNIKNKQKEIDEKRKKAKLKKSETEKQMKEAADWLFSKYIDQAFSVNPTKPRSYHKTEQSTKNIIALFKKGMDPNKLGSAIDSYFENIQNPEYVYACSNFFGQKAYFKDYLPMETSDD